MEQEHLQHKSGRRRKREGTATEHNLQARRQTMVRLAKRTLAVIAVVLLAGLGIWYLATRPPLPEDEVIARNGIHWHANLGITMDGVSVGIPKDIGIGVNHKPVHTHEADGVIHMEFPGLVRRDDVQLGKFFEAWGKPFSQTCVLETCRQPGGAIKMLVNGQPNTDFDRYLMKDNDNIAITYEK